MAVGRRDKGQNPGTQTAGSPEGAVGDGQMSVEVDILMSGSPAQIAADYATLTTNASALATAKTISWKKR